VPGGRGDTLRELELERVVGFLKVSVE